MNQMNGLQIETNGSTDMLTPVKLIAKKLIVLPKGKVIVVDNMDALSGDIYLGEGTLRFNNNEDGWWTPTNNWIQAKNINLVGNVKLEKSRRQDATTGAALYATDTFHSNGFKIQGSGNDYELTKNTLFAKSTQVGGLDATDFELVNSGNGNDNLYFSSRNDGKEIYVRELDAGTKLIKVSGGGEADQYYASYALAIKSLSDKQSGTYTITNYK